MADNFYNNLSDREKSNLADALGAAQNATATFANVSGDDFTGLTNFTTITSSGNASLNSANIPSITGAAVKGSTLAMTGLASISSAQIPVLTTARGVFTSLASFAQIRVFSDIATNPALTVLQSVLGSATCAPLNLVASTSSQAVFSISGVFMSSASYIEAAGSAFVIPIYHESQKVWGYINVLKNVAT